LSYYWLEVRLLPNNPKPPITYISRPLYSHRLTHLQEAARLEFEPAIEALEEMERQVCGTVCILGHLKHAVCLRDAHIICVVYGPLCARRTTISMR
jgi:hypothetical protein